MINVALGSGGPPCNNTLDQFTEMKQASTLQKVDRLDPTVVDAAAVFGIATINGASAAGFDRLGKLKEGWRADIVGLSAETTRPCTIHSRIASRPVARTWN